jgi:hypothetical protein
MNQFTEKRIENQILTERRTHMRMQATHDVIIFLGNMFYSGRALNVSEIGMFINTRMSIPSQSMFILIIHLDNETLKVTAKVERIMKNNGISDGMGVKLFNPTSKYKNFVNNLLPVF